MRLMSTNWTKGGNRMNETYAYKMAAMWQKYAGWRKFWFKGKSLTMDDFYEYMLEYHNLDITI